MKIFSLAIGLALGTVLISKVSFEESYNNLCNDSQRIYLVSEIFENNDGENEEYPQTPGGIAVYMRQFIPDIETSTRYTWSGGGNTFTISNSREKINATYAVADTCLFDILTRRIIQGNPKEVLCTELQAMVSESPAKKIGPDGVGKTIFLDGKEETKISIGGIFEDLPENSDFQMDMFLSMPSIRHFTWDGSMNLSGNDRYTSLVKLRPGADISVVQEYTARFMTEYAPEYANMSRLNLIPLSDYHDFVSSARNMKVLLSLIAFALLFTAVMNYVLLSLSAIIYRSKQIAVRKCYGASSWDIYRNILMEACVHTLIALILAFLLLFAFRGTVEKIAGTPLTTLLGSSIHWILLTVVIIILLGGLLPGMVFARIPQLP